jgi:hypothetical protein
LIGPDCHDGSIGKVSGAVGFPLTQVAPNSLHACFILTNVDRPPNHVHAPTLEVGTVVGISAEPRRAEIDRSSPAVGKRHCRVGAEEGPNIEVVNATIIMHEVLSATLAQTHEDASAGIDTRRGSIEQRLQVRVREFRQPSQVVKLDPLI